MMRSRTTSSLVALVLGLGTYPGEASAHGLVGRADLPIPEWLFGPVAFGVLVISFIALAALWTTPQLEGDRVNWRPLPRFFGRSLTSPVFEGICGLIGVVLFGVLLWSGLGGTQIPTANFAPTFVYVIFWVGLIVPSVLIGDVYRLFNPFRAIARTFSWLLSKLSKGGLPEALPYPEKLGYWPAAIGIFLFAWMELVSGAGDTPSSVAVGAIIYFCLTMLGYGLYGIDQWNARGDAFSVYFNLFSRISPFERRDRDIGVTRPLAKLAGLKVTPGLVAMLMVMIGSVTFDGGSENPLWFQVVRELEPVYNALGGSAQLTIELTYGTGLIFAILFVSGFYFLGVAGAHTVDRSLSTKKLAGIFAPSLVPIAFAYAGAHYFSLVVYQSQAMGYLSSDPLGNGSNFFGTSSRTIDYTYIDATQIWYVQVGLVVVGHILALVLAHDKALTVYSNVRQATRSQYWMLAVMVGFTSLALWLLYSANNG